MRRAMYAMVVLAVAGCRDTEAEGVSSALDSDSLSGSSDGPGSSGAPPAVAASKTYGEPHVGQYHLGPVDFAETEWHNACAPAGGYRQALRRDTGLGNEYLAGVSNAFSEAGGVCDACILIETGAGRSIVARVVTYGATNEPGDIDVSPSISEVLDTGEWPRSMQWTFAKCPEGGTLAFEFQTEANIWWTSLWVRNPRVPLTKVEVKSLNHPRFFALRRETDGTFNDDGGFGDGPFALRLTAMDGQVIEETFEGFAPGELIISEQQFE